MDDEQRADNYVLQHVSLCNFKLLPGLQDVHLAGTTVIMGQNGVGKSNLIDAILFGFGESNPHTLRVNTLKELLCEQATHQDGDSQCYVRLTFSPNIGDIMLFQRSLNHDGSSIYYFNNETVTRSDYHGELMQLHIYINRKHLTMMQGMIPHLTNSKQLCEQFECYSGSNEYKAEFDKLFKRYRELREELTRTRKTCNEFRQRLNKTKQANTVNNELLNTRNDTVVEYLLLNIQHNNREIDDKQEKLLELTNQACNVEEQLKVYKTEEVQMNALLKFLGRGKKVPLEIEKPMEKAKQKCMKAEEVLQMKKSVLQLKQDESELISQQITLINEELARCESETHNETLANQQYEVELQSLSKIQLTQDQKTEYSSMSEKFALETFAEKLQLDHWKQLISDEKEIALKEKIEMSLEKYSQQIQKHHIRGEELYSGIKEDEQTLRQCQSEVGECGQELETLRAQFKSVQKTSEILSRQIKDYAELQRKKLLEAQIGQVEDLVPTEVWKGRLLDVCQVKAPYASYADVLYHFLEKHANAVNIANVDSVAMCASAMKLTDTQPFKIFPLENLCPPQEIPDAVLQQFPNGVPLIDMFTFKKQFSNAMYIICDNIMFFRTNEEAMAASKSVKALSASGNFYHKYGASILIGQRKPHSRYSSVEHANLQKKKDEIADQYTLILKRQEEIYQKILKCEKTRGDCENELAFKTKELQIITKLLPSTQNLLDTCQKSLEKVNNMLDYKRRYFDKADFQIKELEARLQEREISFFSRFCQTHSIENIKFVVESDSKREELLSKIKVCEASLKTLEEQHVSLQTNRDTLQTQIQSFEEDLQTKVAAVQAAQIAFEAEKAAFERKQAQTDNITTTQNETVQKVNETLQSFNDLSQKQSQLNTEYNLIARRINNLTEQMMRLKETRHSFFMIAQKRHILLPMVSGSDSTFSDLSLSTLSLSDKYDMESLMQLNVEHIDADKLALAGEEFDIYNDDAVVQIAELDRQVAEKALSVGKLSAIIEDCKTQISMTNARCNELMREQKEVENDFNRVKSMRNDCFRSCFDSISDAIDGVYKAMHGRHAMSVSANLFLGNADEPYDGEVIYTCIQHNKPYCVLDKMSLGERSLAAIALFFALRAAIPTPLLMLDEVDSALGTNAVRNVSSFIRSREMSGERSLIVTHRPEMAVGCGDMLVTIIKRPLRDGKNIFPLKL